jgi:putative membrane protein
VSIITILLVRLGIIAAAFGITAWLLSGMEVSGGFWGYIWVALLFGLVNAILGTILKVLTLPFILLTFGLLAILINALLLEITDALTDNLTIDDFWWTTIWASIILAIVTVVLDYVVASLVTRSDDDPSPAVSH